MLHILPSPIKHLRILHSDTGSWDLGSTVAVELDACVNARAEETRSQNTHLQLNI